MLAESVCIIFEPVKRRASSVSSLFSLLNEVAHCWRLVSLLLFFMWCHVAGSSQCAQFVNQHISMYCGFFCTQKCMWAFLSPHQSGPWRKGHPHSDRWSTCCCLLLLHVLQRSGIASFRTVRQPARPYVQFIEGRFVLSLVESVKKRCPRGPHEFYSVNLASVNVLGRSEAVHLEAGPHRCVEDRNACKTAPYRQ